MVVGVDWDIRNWWESTGTGTVVGNSTIIMGEWSISLLSKSWWESCGSTAVLGWWSIVFLSIPAVVRWSWFSTSSLSIGCWHIWHIWSWCESLWSTSIWFHGSLRSWIGESWDLWLIVGEIVNILVHTLLGDTLSLLQSWENSWESLSHGSWWESLWS